MSYNLGKSIRLFLVDGTPQGILTLEVVNWTGHILSSPRSKITELIQRPEMNRTGVYFLIGPDPENINKVCVYIGESDNVGKRLVQHNKDESKAFWESVCIVTSKDQNLTKAHARYLESKIISMAHAGGNAVVLNGTSPDFEILPEADIADMQYFIAQISLILPVLGLNFLKEKPRLSLVKREILQFDEVLVRESPFFEINSKKHDIKAVAKEIEGGFVVLAGSICQAEWIGVETNYKALREALFHDGRIKILDAGKAVFQEDVVFNSPSAAANIVLGRSANGRFEWKVQGSSKTYADWQNEQIDKIEQILQ